MIRGVILEGLSCSGKTSMLNALKKSHSKNPENERSVIVLGEHYSQVLQNINGVQKAYSRDEHLSILSERVEHLERLNDFSISLGPYSRRARGIFFIFERFHLNHRQAFPGYQLEEIILIEKRLEKLNASCYLMSISNEKVKERLVARDSNLSSLPEPEQDRQVEEYVKCQDELRSIAESSRIDYKIINTDTLDWERYSDEVLRDLDAKH